VRPLLNRCFPRSRAVFFSQIRQVHCTKFSWQRVVVVRDAIRSAG
jgi:hypothetical protein